MSRARKLRNCPSTGSSPLEIFAPRQHHFAVGAKAIVDFVAFVESKSATHGFRYRGLVAVSQGGFAFKGGGRGELLSNK